LNYYNEYEPFAAKWLKQLIVDGLIPPGDVDDRSIADVESSDLSGYTQCHFFAGIGGWSRALEIAQWDSDRPVWTGSPPCQSFSVAGKGKGKDDERHLWPVFFNLIRECNPPAVFGEQVAAAIKFGWLDDLQNDFEKEGYASGACVLPSGAVGSPHKRDRLFFVADSLGKRSEGICGSGEERITEHSETSSTLADPCGERWEGSERSWETREEGKSERYGSERSSNSWEDSTVIYCRDGKHRPIPVESALFPLADGIPNRVGILRGAGNAIVPQAAAEIIKAVM